jgi:glutamate-1-semialdehyde 2,1-aminomutase
MKYTHRPHSEKIFKSSCQVIPGGVNSPVRSFPGLDMTPMIVQRGQGAMIWDEDQNSYIDYCGGWGSLILGHAHPYVVEAASNQIMLGSSFGISTLSELQLAERIVRHYSSIEKVRFVSSGTEAVMSAVRLARGYTNKNTILKFNGNYHGHFDSFLVQAGSGVSNLENSSSKGIPADFIKHTVSLPYNETELVRAFIQNHSDLAAVVIEPVAGNMGVVPAKLNFLTMLREETEKKGIVLIFDEVISGFRVGLSGAQGLYQIKPDLTTLGKIIGGGFPAAAFGGKKAIMDCLSPLGPVYQAGTLSGNPVAMKAGLATIAELEKPNFYEELQLKTNYLLAPLKKADITINQVGSMFTLFVGEKRYQHLFKALFEKGIYFPPSQQEACFISSAHKKEQLEFTQKALIQILIG